VLPNCAPFVAGLLRGELRPEEREVRFEEIIFVGSVTGNLLEPRLNKAAGRQTLRVS